MFPPLSSIVSTTACGLLVGVFVWASLWSAVGPGCAWAAGKNAELSRETPAPQRFFVQGDQVFDREHGDGPVFFRGMGYSPFLVGETPLTGADPQDDGRFAVHLPMMRELGVNYVHVFPRHMPAGFFEALEREDLVYGQDIWLFPYERDFLDPEYQARQLALIKEVIDHTYRVGRPERLVLFSIGDELQAASVGSTNAAHPEVRDYVGKHVVVRNRTASEVAMAKLMDEAMAYELNRYGQRHLYCHTSWTHIGPITDRPDLEVRPEDALVPDMGDLICMNIYTYANAVRSSGPGRSTGTSYQGYLEQLAWESHKPILITQVGLSTSPIEPKPWVPGFGGHRIEDVATAFTAIWKDLRSAQDRERFCGLVFFEWQDEWWKSGETLDDSEGHAPEDPEEWFGLYELGQDNRLIPKGRIPETVRGLFHEP